MNRLRFCIFALGFVLGAAQFARSQQHSPMVPCDGTIVPIIDKKASCSELTAQFTADVNFPDHSERAISVFASSVPESRCRQRA